MKQKKYLILAIGIITGFCISIPGLSYASQRETQHLNLITSEKAKTIMLDKVPGATILEFSYDEDDKTPKYDGTLIKDDYEYEIDVNAKTGEVSKFEKEKIAIPNNKQDSSNFITEEKAKSIMLSKVEGAKIVKFYLDNDSTPEYEGELIKGNVEYEISVDAKTGAIKEFSQEKIDTYDNDDDRYDDDDDDDDDR